MLSALALSVAGVLLLALAAERQARWAFGAAASPARRTRARRLGWLLLGLSLLLVLAGGDRARALIEWIGANGVAAILVALALSPLSPRRG